MWVNIGGANGVEEEFEEKSPVCWEKEREERDRYERWSKREKEKERETTRGISEKVTAKRRGWKKYSRIRGTIPAARRNGERERLREVGKTRTVKCHRAILIYDGREIGGVQLRAESVRCRKPRNFCSNFHRRGWLAIKKMYPVLDYVFSLKMQRIETRKS